MGTSTATVSSAAEANRYRRSRSVVSRFIAGETLVVPIRGKVGDLAAIYSFNEAASVLWTALEHPRSVEHLASLLNESFDVGWDDARRDVMAFVGEMQAAGLLTSEPA